MHVERTVLPIGELLSQISRTEIRLPELQREYVWRPTQVAKLVDSLYQGFPVGSLLFWQAEKTPMTRSLSIGGETSEPFREPLTCLTANNASHRCIESSTTILRPRSFFTSRGRGSRTRACLPKPTLTGSS